MQISVAIAALIILIGLDHWSRREQSSQPWLWRFPSPKAAQKLRRSLFTALVDFHKSQCYFAGAIQIAALVLVSQIDAAQAVADYLDAELLVTISTSGFVPVIFTLTCIAHFGQSSWYLISLSILTGILSTGTLGSAWFFWTSNTKDSSFMLSELGYGYSDKFACGTGFDLSQAGGLCGLNELPLTGVDPRHL